MKLFLALIMILVSFSAQAATRCVSGPDTPSTSSNFCPFYKQQLTCVEFGCEWQVYENCSAGANTPDVTKQFCPFYKEHLTCVQFGCEWTP